MSATYIEPINTGEELVKIELVLEPSTREKGRNGTHAQRAQRLVEEVRHHVGLRLEEGVDPVATDELHELLQTLNFFLNGWPNVSNIFQFKHFMPLAKHLKNV